MNHLAESVYYNHDGIISTIVWKSSDKVHSDDFPDIFGNLSRHQLSNWLFREGLCSVTSITTFNIGCNVFCHPRPPIVSRDQFQSLPFSWVTNCLTIMM